MAKYAVGLDFGTHQTKICIQNTLVNPRFFEFLEFTDSNSNKTHLIPSVVQINKDNTVSYGFVDELKVKTPLINEVKRLKPKPVFCNPQPLEPILPPVPFTQNIVEPKPPVKENFKSKKAYKSYMIKYNSLLVKYNNLKKSYLIKLVNWEKECELIKKEHLERFNNKLITLKENHLFEYEKWEKEPYEIIKKTINFHYRYFKMPNYNAYYRNLYEESFDINYFYITVLYLTYILFLIEEKIGNEYTIQMGIPTNTNTLSEHKNNSFIGKKILVYSYELKKSFKCIDSFLSTDIYNLIERINSIKLSNIEIDEKSDKEYWIGIIPEAFAGLLNVTKNKKISKGMYISIDIGGGTTDIALFTINEHNEPLIHCGYSLAQGINDIFKALVIENSKDENNLQLMIEIQKSLDNTSKIRNTNAIKLFKEELSKTINNIFSEIVDCALKTNQIRNSKEIKALFYEKVKDQTILLSGGGSYYSEIIPETQGFFSERKLIDSSMIEDNLSIKEKGKVENQFLILANAFGLAHPFWNDIVYKRFDELDTWQNLKIKDFEIEQQYIRYDNSD